jgi:hypothetical protein
MQDLGVVLTVKLENYIIWSCNYYDAGQALAVKTAIWFYQKQSVITYRRVRNCFPLGDPIKNSTC